MAAYLANDQDVQFFQSLRERMSQLGMGANSTTSTGEIINRRVPGKPHGEFRSTVQLFVVKTINNDTLTCRSWLNGAEGDNLIAVMKPHNLQKTPFDNFLFSDWQGTGLNTTITYQDSTHRTATEAVSLNKRFEKVYPEWNVEQGDYLGDVITASTVRGVLDMVASDDEDEDAVLWADINDSGRHWTEDEPVPSSMTTVGAETEGESEDGVTITQYPATTGKAVGWEHVQLSRVAYGASSAFYAFYRTVQYYRSGRWYRVQAESKVTIFTTEVC